MDYHSPPHFPFHKNRYIYSEFLWKAGLAEKGPCTDLLSSEPSLGIPSPFFLHEARRKNTKVKTNKRTLGGSSISSLGAQIISWGSATETQNYTNCKEQDVTESSPCLTATNIRFLDFVKSHSSMNSCWKPTIMRSINSIL